VGPRNQPVRKSLGWRDSPCNLLLKFPAVSPLGRAQDRKHSQLCARGR